jgi:hypothetical protein
MNDNKTLDFVRQYIIGEVAHGYIVGDLKRLLSINVVDGRHDNCKCARRLARSKWCKSTTMKE